MRYRTPESWYHGRPIRGRGTFASLQLCSIMTRPPSCVASDELDQTAFGEVSAGIRLSTFASADTLHYPIRIAEWCVATGLNAVRALKGLGLLDAVLQKLSPGDYSSKGILMYSGLGDHELIYHVCILCTSPTSPQGLNPAFS